MTEAQEIKISNKARVFLDSNHKLLINGEWVASKSGEKIAVISIGHIGNMIIEMNAELKLKNINLGHYNLRFLKPLDEKLLNEVLTHYPIIITVEDGCLKGGMGSAVLEFSNENNYNNRIIRFGVPDKFIEHGSPSEHNNSKNS